VTQYRIAVTPKHTHGTQNGFVKTAHQLGISALKSCFITRLYFIEGELSPTQLHQIAEELVADPIVERYELEITPLSDELFIEVTLQVGVTDPVAESLHRAIRQLGIYTATQTASGQHYHLSGNLTPSDLDHLASTLFCNTVIQRYTLNQHIQPPFIASKEGDGLVEMIALRTANDEQLIAISKERRLSLDLAEMKAIQAYYQQEKREPRDTELETLAQTWSEHCVHKTFRATIDFSDEEGNQETINGLLKTYIRAATEKLSKEWVVSAFVDNAGIIKFNDTFDIAFKVETHNHPSALEPFGGANTGVGGVVRDVLGVSARPIANTDVLCFGYEDLPESALLDGVLHPRRIQDGVIAGIEDYGNKMGIPTVNGAILYDNAYTANPLVFCGCLGILPHGSHPNTAKHGDYIVVLGGRTGRDGLRGATFSSMEMDTSTSEIASISVQIGHPINEKQVQEVVIRARDEKLYTAITDCGAGGLSSAVGEMGKDLGAMVHLETVPLKYSGLRPWEIWLSEAQERMVMAVSHQHWDRLCEIAKIQDVEITNIGTYENSGRLVLKYNNVVVGDMEMHFLHEGIPTRHLKAHWQTPHTSPTPEVNTSAQETLLKLLAHPNIRSKEKTVRLYDHEVQGGTVVKPFGGVENKAPNNGAVIVPLDTKHAVQDGKVKGVALSNGVCPQYGKQDPYAMAWAAIDEAFRNLVAMGADPDQVAILDNFCWGNPNLPDRLGALVLTSKGCYDAALAYGAPFISGKDSLNNEYADADGKRHAIPGTLLISAVGIVPDVQKTVSMDFKKADSALFLIGETREELSQSHLHMVTGVNGGVVPQPNRYAMTTLRALYQAMQAGVILACHDLSEGGLAVTLAEMSIGGGFGVKVTYQALDNAFTNLFSETSTRFVVEVSDVDIFKKIMSDIKVEHIGQTTSEPILEIQSVDTQIKLSIVELESAWRGIPSAKVAVDIPVPNTEETLVLRAPNKRTTPPKALILHANGSNRDRDAALAIELAGGVPEIVHINQLINHERNLADYDLMIVPGGFSYGDDLGAGQLWAQDLRYHFQDSLETFVKVGKPVLGICNGFQVLVKSGLLPAADFAKGQSRTATLTNNEAGHFECRWVYLQPNPHSTSLFTHGLIQSIYCPIAHGEGRVLTKDNETLESLWKNGQVALQYIDNEGKTSGYPFNPNGSVWNIAALSNPEGNVMGLMPHPENHIFAWQHPRYHRGEHGMSGLILFKNAIKYA
jgi:phosphoribosylformylglycinamidine synthase II/phosphoribosylformylglycinamidine synthase I